MTMSAPRQALFAAAAALLAVGCRGSPWDDLDRRAPHERYAEGLRSAGLDSTALGRDWLRASEQALYQAPPIALPYRESGYFPSDEARATGYLLQGRRGQRLLINVRTDAARSFRLFVDLFRPPEQAGEKPEHVGSADTVTGRLELELEQDGPYLLRLQPELLRSGRYELEVRAAATLGFPVVGRDSRAILSRYGAERDGGRRLHEGIDIFAPRGTPVVAAASGIATPGVNRLGGNVVWLWDALRGRVLYYAHLERHAVAAGTRVTLGDTLGFVGNTGNARTTPPHLHFGIYHATDGAVDPYPFVHDPREEAPPVIVTAELLGRWARVAARRASLQVAPSDSAPEVARLPRRSVLRVDAAVGEWCRVALPDGQVGFIAGAALEDLAEPVARSEAGPGAVLREQPSFTSTEKDSLRSETPLAVLGRFGDFVLVQTPRGTGWLPQPT